MAAKGGRWKESQFVPAKGTEPRHGGASTGASVRHIELRGDLSADDGLHAHRAGLRAMQQARAREGRGLTERYQPALEKLREARDDMKRGLKYAADDAQRALVKRVGEARMAEARAELDALRAQRSKEQDRARAQGDLFGGFPSARPSRAEARARFEAAQRFNEILRENEVEIHQSYNGTHHVYEKGALRGRFESEEGARGYVRQMYSVEGARAKRAAEERERKRAAIRAEFAHDPERTAAMQVRSAGVAAIAEAAPPPKGHHLIRYSTGIIQPVKTLFRVGSLAVHKEASATGRAKHDRYAVTDVRSGVLVERFRSAGVARKLVQSSGKSADRVLGRAVAGDRKAQLAWAAVVRRAKEADGPR